ncbi:BRO1 domain-containing protein [Cephalotus follicularis]|uniref:BRO1 domain-containing protein n=1 Tax=Cephalotus follicularis TaxID=3775 RepID=A0A1Q3AU12_CEPFO|nr:BRO1 domain-containing protein [Cephalotus follicularis]
MMLLYPDPAKLKTKKIVFEDAYAARDSATLEHLKELSSRRKVLEESINESSSITPAIAREISGGLTSRYQQDLQRLEQYLPLLENLFFQVNLVSSNLHMIQWTSKLKIRWSSALSSSSFFNLGGPKFCQIDNLQFEHGMALFLYGAILRERAVEILPSDMVQSATLFREAAGVFHYLACEVLPTLQPALSAETPLETIPSISTVMQLICLAEAQAVTIRKAEGNGSTVSLLAKLHYGVADLLGEAAQVLYAVTGERKDISSRFVDFISSCRALHTLRGQIYVAESLKIAGQIGVGVAVLREALINVKNKMPGEESWIAVFKKEIDHLSDTLRKLEHENEFVWHEKIPSGDGLPFPQGNKIVNIIPYHPKRWERQLAFKI